MLLYLGLDIFLCVLRSPEGRTQNSPGLQPWEGAGKENRPERAADYPTLFPKITFFRNIEPG